MELPATANAYDVVHGLLSLSTARGLRHRVMTEHSLDDWDDRLVLCREGHPIEVELLLAHGPYAAARHWHAVRVTPLSRQVWQGPASDCGAEDLLRFVETLLAAHSWQVRRGYRLLG